jgi:hypothetical protein
MHDLVERALPLGQEQREGIGLVTHYLFSPQPRRGIVVRWTPALSADELAQAVETGMKELASAAKARARKPGLGE